MATTTNLRTRIEQLEAEAEEASKRYLRLAADFDNYKKRVRQDQADAQKQANAELIGKLLPVVDNLHRVLDSAPEGVEEAWLKGFQLTLQQLDDLLAAYGVVPIEAVGRPFDPTEHEAIGHEDSDEHPEDTVVTEIRKGYRLHDRVVRPALVRVARPVGD
ncbi:MAG: nucleotide exchange factor GrpE [Chloroflexi bacterium]|nr:MAG: nucleotide exchange factor GrpE [Chloroflexota bacterium]TMD54672.1 MAG: nucleotide exchange factor GrpE [Chloroflexota bacterium]